MPATSNQCAISLFVGETYEDFINYCAGVVWVGLISISLKLLQIEKASRKAGDPTSNESVPVAAKKRKMPGF